MLAAFLRNRRLVFALVQREVVGRYRGSILGIAWSFFNPVFMLAVYTFVFSVVFKARWASGSDSKIEFALVLFAGLIVFNLFAESVNRAPGLIVGNTNFVKKVVFPLEILPVVALGSSLFHALISLAVWLLAYLLFFGSPHPTVVFLPLVLVPLLLLVLGLSWFLASLGTYLRDVSQFVTVVVSVLMFLSPIFYPVSALPERFQLVLHVNPMTTVIEQTRAVLYWGNHPDFVRLGISTLMSFLLAWGGFAWFQKTRRGFADVL